MVPRPRLLLTITDTDMKGKNFDTVQKYLEFINIATKILFNLKKIKKTEPLSLNLTLFEIEFQEKNINFWGKVAPIYSTQSGFRIHNDHPLFFKERIEVRSINKIQKPLWDAYRIK
jgi:hypothetical protein